MRILRFFCAVRLFVFFCLLVSARSLTAGMVNTIFGHVKDHFIINSYIGRQLATVSLDNADHSDGSLSCEIHLTSPGQQTTEAISGIATQAVLQSIHSQLNALTDIPQWLHQADIAAALTVLAVPQNAFMPQLNEHLQVTAVAVHFGNLTVNFENGGQAGTMTLSQPTDKRHSGHIMVQVSARIRTSTHTRIRAGSYFIYYGEGVRPIVVRKGPPAKQDEYDGGPRRTISRWNHLLCCGASGQESGKSGDGQSRSEASSTQGAANNTVSLSPGCTTFSH